MLPEYDTSCGAGHMLCNFSGRPDTDMKMSHHMCQFLQILMMFFLCFQATVGWAGQNSPVVVELFESQGCSSCPPAERTVERLEREFEASIIFLVFHVAYWDYLRWKGTFSAKC